MMQFKSTPDVHVLCSSIKSAAPKQNSAWIWYTVTTLFMQWDRFPGDTHQKKPLTYTINVAIVVH